MRKPYNIREPYRDLEYSMAQIVSDPDEAFSIIWFDIYEWLEPKDPNWKYNICDILTNNILDQHIWYQFDGYTQGDLSYYQGIFAKYGFGKSVDKLGEYWKELIRNKDVAGLRSLLTVLKIYHKEVMPYAKNEMMEFFKFHGHDYPDWEPTREPYKEHQEKVEKTMEIIKITLGIFSL